VANFRTWIARNVPRVLATDFGEKLTQTFALMFDLAAEGARQAVRGAWVGDRRQVGPAIDALGLVGAQRSLPQYPVETWAQYHARLQRAWVDWIAAGDETSIIGQLETAGFPGAVIYTKQSNPTMFASSDWSQFVVFFPLGTHTVTAPAAAWGSFNWGDGTNYGAVGITPAEVGTIRAIIRKFKPGHWRCDGIIFEISGWTYGTGHTWGEGGLVWGGVTARIGA
jgi:hypothetical protein